MWGYDIELFNYFKEKEILLEPERSFIIDDVLPPLNGVISINCIMVKSPLIINKYESKKYNYIIDDEKNEDSDNESCLTINSFPQKTKKYIHNIINNKELIAKKNNNNNNDESKNFNIKKEESFIPSPINFFPYKNEPKKDEIFCKSNTNKNSKEINFSNIKEHNLKDNKNKIKEISAKIITKLFKKLLNLKKLFHLKVFREITTIPSSEYKKELDPQQLNVNLTPDINCIYLGNKFNGKRDGLGLEHFKTSNAKYFGYFRNGKRVDYGTFKISNKVSHYSYRGEIEGIYAKGFGIFSDNKNCIDYLGYFENSMKNGYGIEIKKDNHNYVYKSCFINGKKEGIGIAKLNNGSIYEGEWKNNLAHGFGICQFNDGSLYEGKWENNHMSGFGIFTCEEKKYFGYFKKNSRFGFGICLWFNHKKAFIGFWKDNTMDGYGKLILNDEISYGLWREGKIEKKYEEKEFYKKIKEENIGFFNYFIIDDYKMILNSIN